MALLKIARTVTGTPKADNYVDLAGYAACAWGDSGGGRGMTNKDKKAWLKRYSAIDRQIKNKTDELSMWRSRATKITPTYSGLPKGGAGIEYKPQLITSAG